MPHNNLPSRRAVPLSFLHRVLSLLYHFPLIAAPPAFPLPATAHTLAYANDQLSKRQDAFEDATQSKRHRERGRSRSYSPPRAQTSRRCRRSQSPHQRGQESPSDRRGRDTGRPARKQEFFQSSAAPRGGVCVACLGRHDYPFANCDGTKLWDGSASTSKKNEQGRIVARDGLPICFNFQIARGCSNNGHPDRHRCSGCGKKGHGAQGCPRAEKA